MNEITGHILRFELDPNDPIAQLEIGQKIKILTAQLNKIAELDGRSVKSITHGGSLQRADVGEILKYHGFVKAEYDPARRSPR